MPEVVRLCGDVFEEIESQAACRLSRIVSRITYRRSSPADVEWLLARAEDMEDDLILTANPFGDCSDDGARELWRKVVRGRKTWVCHWTRRRIGRGNVTW